ncbi:MULTISPECIES: endolytic transglycosylase MltG [Salinibacter]|uniref:endolytic transglycosylase MltG n=1 Tax=Salinibacter TaxID=146918 RepID=UPI001ABB3407|nr:MULTISPECIES: endolytic transglycosylase MltG [Salinibacter]
MYARSRLGVVVAILFVGGLVAGVGGALVFGPNTGGYDAPRSVYIARGATLDTAIDSLAQADVLVVPAAFRLVARATGWGQQIKSGHYRIASRRSNYALLDKLRRGLQDPVRLTLPPGVQPGALTSVLGRRLERDADAFRAALRDTSLAEALDSTPARLFGYMLPETYEFYWQTPPEAVVRRLKQGFDRFYERELAAGADSLGLTKREVVTLASIVEWEALVDAEKPAIAGVYLNRLTRGWPLQADPTIQYVLLDTKGTRVTRVLYEHLEIDHPYNTYQNQGLPPGPITNPSPSSLRAAARPERHEYLYFAADGTGGHTFSRTLREHNRAAEKYQQMLDERRSDGRP